MASPITLLWYTAIVKVSININNNNRDKQLPLYNAINNTCSSSLRNTDLSFINSDWKYDRKSQSDRILIAVTVLAGNHFEWTPTKNTYAVLLGSLRCDWVRRRRRLAKTTNDGGGWIDWRTCRLKVNGCPASDRLTSTDRCKLTTPIVLLGWPRFWNVFASYTRTQTLAQSPTIWL